MSGDEFGEMLPRVRVPPPGPASRALADRLRRVESRNVTYLAEDFPVFWSEARGANVRDADGNVHVDLTAAFGVALLGHGDAGIRRAVADQMERLVHGMGDVHPPTLKVELLERLARLLPWEDSRTVLATGGSEAVEVALKTTLLATGRPGILSFEGGYHGLTQGALAATARADFRDPFRERLYPGRATVPFPGPGEAAATLEAVADLLERGAPNGDPIGAVVVEPIQGRGGLRIPPPGFLAELGSLTRAAGALVVADEIFTGLGRTGALLASESTGLAPDLLCLGKALGGGFPLSACSGPASVMDAWPASRGEALHTSTFLGHPATAAAAVAFLRVLEEDRVPARAGALGARIRKALEDALEESGVEADVRGRGLMLGVEVGAGRGPEVAGRALSEGVLVLPAGDGGGVVELTPPICLTDRQVEASAEILARSVATVVGRAGAGTAS